VAARLAAVARRVMAARVGLNRRPAGLSATAPPSTGPRLWAIAKLTVSSPIAAVDFIGGDERACTGADGGHNAKNEPPKMIAEAIAA
jgi:hypothetical protein